MSFLFICLVVLAVVFIGFFILIQNPKGGGMDSAIMGGVGNQIFGVQRSTNILEKGTWILATIILILCLSAPFFIAKKSNSSIDKSSQEEEFLQKFKP